MPWRGAALFTALSLIFLAPGADQAKDKKPSAETRILESTVFEEPLAISGPKSPQHEEESEELSEALESYVEEGDGEDVEPFLEFLDEYPDSAWRLSLLTDLGILYKRAGYLTRAVQAWEGAWDSAWDAALAQEEEDPAVVAGQLGGRAFGELVEINARLGRADRLEALLSEIDEDALTGPATELVSRAKGSLWYMQANSGEALKCGAVALSHLSAWLDPDAPFDRKLLAYRATPSGMSLTQTADFAGELGLDLQMAKRSKDGAFLTPAIVHWKSDHYAALLDKSSVDGEARFLVYDSAFGSQRWVSQRAMEDESSGYYLVPQGALPAGWSAVSEAEGDTVWGSGPTDYSDPEQTTPDSEHAKSPDCNVGMANYNFHTLLASLNITDTPLSYTPPLGPPIRFTVTYNERELYQPTTFRYSNLGPKWTFDYLSYVTDDGTASQQTVTVYRRGGGQETYPSTSPTEFVHHYRSQAILVKSLTPQIRYERTLPDGTKEVFDKATTGTGTRKVFMTQIVDPQGNTIRLDYDSNYRITTIWDALNQPTTLAYTQPNDIYKITGVTDPFQHTATFEYYLGHLKKITDPALITSTFEYGTNDFVRTLTTPYSAVGTTFNKGVNPNDPTNRWIVATDPLGGQERIEFREEAPGVLGADLPPSLVPSGMVPALNNSYLNNRDSFYWDKKISADINYDYQTNYNKARITHWLHKELNTASGVKESTRNPLENRVWYTYPGQNDATMLGTSAQPRQVGRVLDDGTTQLSQYDYNLQGNVTLEIDPVGRQTRYGYTDNGIDLLKVDQTTGDPSKSPTTDDRLATYADYDSNHRPWTYFDASLQETDYEYNPQGQLTRVTNARGEVTNFEYTFGTNPYGYLTSIWKDLGAGRVDFFTFTPDSMGRLWKSEDVDHYVITRDYDDLNRPTRVTYPDNTYEQITYDKLDPHILRDRLNRLTTLDHDALRHLTHITYPDSTRTVDFGWCGCGSLTSMTDRQDRGGLGGAVTTWQYDLQGRVAYKIFDDQKRIHYVYDPTISRLSFIEYPSLKNVNYQYYADDTLALINYSDPGTQDVSFEYDQVYNRLLTRTDGTGLTSFTYGPVLTTPTTGANELLEVDGPLASSDVVYGYDELGRRVSQTVHGTTSSITYDNLGRVETEVNLLGTFIHNYVGVTGRLDHLDYPSANGQVTHYSYFGNSGDKRLDTIDNRNSSNGVISSSSYTWYTDGDLKDWTQSPRNTAWRHTYDDIHQLKFVREQPSDTQKYAYTYDLAWNRLTETTPTGGTTWVANDVNQVETQTPSGGSATTFAYDDDGNLLWDGVRSYEWDGENRLTAVEVTGSYRSEFSYDGAGHRTRILELNGQGATVADHYYLWCGDTICEERSGSDPATVTKRFYPWGVEEGGTKYYYTRDHLGSVREITNASGGVVASYDYDPYGRMTWNSGTKVPAFGYAGYFYHAASGLNLTMYRAYDPRLGRWLSRDPIGERGGLNLYGYVGNEPVNLLDPDGLMKLPPNPAGLPPEWTEDKTHTPPDGVRYKHPNGDTLDWNPAQTPPEGYKKGRRTKWEYIDHWHHNGGKWHYRPGSEVPDPEPACKGENAPSDPPNQSEGDAPEDPQMADAIRQFGIPPMIAPLSGPVAIPVVEPVFIPAFP